MTEFPFPGAAAHHQSQSVTGACLAIVNATSKRLEIRLQRRAAVGTASIR